MTTRPFELPRDLAVRLDLIRAKQSLDVTKMDPDEATRTAKLRHTFRIDERR
jgi:hypothetical protein